MKKRILTGDRPTGALHLGHYLGSLQNRVRLQEEYEQFVMVADVQALTDNFDNPQKIRDSITEVVLDYLAVGIDPQRTTIFLQSAIPQIAELTVFYMNLVTVARLQRNPTVKDEMKQKGLIDSVPLGFLAYPVSQAGDITCVNAHLVPVGEDQLPMLEQTREIVRKFNSLYGNVLVEPEPLLGNFPRLVGTDGNSKMSKSLGNAIYLSDSSTEVERKVRGMYTDPNRKHATDPGKVEGNPVFVYLDAFGQGEDKKQIAEYKSRYKEGKVGDVEVKGFLVEVLNRFLEPIRERRRQYAEKPELAREVLRNGTKKAYEEASKTLDAVKRAMKVDYLGDSN
jgi:tryptophanyl-tRNA synthetase